MEIKRLSETPLFFTFYEQSMKREEWDEGGERGPEEWSGQQFSTEDRESENDGMGMRNTGLTALKIGNRTGIYQICHILRHRVCYTVGSGIDILHIRHIEEKGIY